MEKLGKKIKGRIKVLKALLYKGSMIYVRQIDGDLFEYLVIYKSQLYTSYIVLKPRDGHTTLSKSDINKAAAMIFAGAITTIDTLKSNKHGK